MSNSGNIDFDRPAPNIQECKFIILQMIYQAIKDYEHFRYKTKQEEQLIFQTAQHFLFDDEYNINWGDHEVNLEALCSIIETDVNWLRNKIAIRLDTKFLPISGVVVQEKRY